MTSATPPIPARGGRNTLPAAGVMALSLLLPQVCPAEIITNNLDKPVDGIEKVTKTRWLGSRFTTDDKTYLLTDITLKLQRNIPGTFEAAIFSDANGRPGQLIGKLDSKGIISAFPSNVVFEAGEGQTTSFSTTVEDVQLSGAFSAPKGVKITDLPGGSFTATGSQPSGMTLAPNTTYWIVMSSTSGEFASAYTDSEQGSGPGYSSTWAQSANSGGSWQTQATSPLFLGVTGDPSRVIVELRTDFEAIQSTVFSGLPMALAQRDIVLSAVAVTSRDVNERLFRLRTGEDVHKGWEFFVTGRYGAADNDSVIPATGFQADTWAGSIGAEYHDARHLTVGAAFTLMESNNSLGLGVGDVDLSGYALAAYVSYTHSGFYADLMYQFAKFDQEVARNTLFGQTARAEPESDAHTIELNVGYNIETRNFVTGPMVSLTYTTGAIDGYTETGADSKNLQVSGQSFESLVSRVGWQISKTFDLRGVKLTPQFRVAWRHEFMDSEELVSANLLLSPFQVGSGNDFTRVGSFGASSSTAALSADSLEIGFGVLLQMSDRLSLILDYEARVFQGDEVLHSVSLTGGVRF